METFESIRTVLAVREFQQKELPNDVIQKIINAAHLTGSSMNAQPWQFIVVKESRKLEKLGSLVKSGPYIASSALSVVVAVEKSSQYGISDGSRAIQSMILAAWAEGVGSNWAGWSGMSHVAKFVGIPDQYDVIAVIPFGYPVRKIGFGNKSRKKISEVVHKEEFGNPYTEIDI